VTQHPRVDLDGNDFASGFEERGGQRARARAYLDNGQAIGGDGGDDAPKDLGIVKEVLPERLARAKRWATSCSHRQKSFKRALAEGEI
jgi:hypothetical protein